MHEFLPADLIWLERANEGLASKGWFCGEGLIDSKFIDDINLWIERQSAVGSFKSAGIGKGIRLQNNQKIRADLTLWLDDDHDEDPLVAKLLNIVEAIRVSSNRHLFSALNNFEGHFAIYPPGGFYHRHIDTFRDDDARSITFILYLNEGWTSRDGGQLRLFTSGEQFVEIEPTAGTIVLFRSRDFEHEVLPAQAERRSFTGWFKTSF